MYSTHSILYPLVLISLGDEFLGFGCVTTGGFPIREYFLVVWWFPSQVVLSLFDCSSRGLFLCWWWGCMRWLMSQVRSGVGSVLPDRRLFECDWMDPLSDGGILRQAAAIICACFCIWHFAPSFSWLRFQYDQYFSWKMAHYETEVLFSRCYCWRFH